MPIKEARCTNCGSILMVETNDSTAKCLFCRAVVNTQDALVVAANPQGYEFPNEEQPEEESAPKAASIYNKALKQAHTAKTAQRATRAAQPAARAEAAAREPRAQVEKIEMPSVKLSKTAKIQIGAFIVALFVLAAAAILPVTLTRDARRSEMSRQIPAILPFKHVGEGAWSIAKTGNWLFSATADEVVDAETALAVYRDFCAVRAQAYGLDPATDSFRSVYGKVTVRVYGTDGGFVVSGLDGPQDLHNSAVALPLS